MQYEFWCFQFWSLKEYLCDDQRCTWLIFPVAAMVSAGKGLISVY
jgi:hypothetical protein